jgi:hypothetical protein
MIEEDNMGEACSTNGKMRKMYTILAGKPEGRRPPGSPIQIWEDNIKMDLK